MNAATRFFVTTMFLVSTHAAVAGPEPAERPEPVLVKLLATLNYPLRGLSPTMRTLVDWIALSLIFWVPIVWLIALMIVGR